MPPFRLAGKVYAALSILVLVEERVRKTTEALTETVEKLAR